MLNLAKALAELKETPSENYTDNDNKPIKRKLAVVDCETDPFKIGRLPRPFIWGFFDGATYEEFATADEFIEFLERSQTPYRIYAHNGGKFDYHFLLDYLEHGTPLTIISGRIAKFKIGAHEFRDSYNLFAFPLAAYKKDDMDYSIMEESEREKPHNKKKISDYLYKDCLYLFELISSFVAQYGLSLTQAGAAMKQWQKIADRKAPETDEIYYNSLRKYYYGGRVECFRKGIIDRPFESVDIVSAYPFAMLSAHPISETYKTLSGKAARAFCDDLTDPANGPRMFTILARSRGALPLRLETSELIYPTDNALRVYHVTGWEIIAGIETGTLSDIRLQQVHVWDELLDFTDYVGHFYKMKADAKKANDRGGELFAKLFLNSLYGKFASNPDKYRNYKIAELESSADIFEEGYNDGGFIGPWLLGEKPLPDEQRRYYNIATGASITGFVRAYLWRAACRCNGLLYCDTDSIAAHDISALELGDDLGNWEYEYAYKGGAIAGKKLYAFEKQEGGWKTASKGTKLEARQIVRIARGEKIEYQAMVPTYSVHHAPRFTNREIVKT